MSEEICSNCGSKRVTIARNMKATRICYDCRHRWEPIDWKARAEKAEAALEAKTRELEQARLLIEGLHKAYKKEIAELVKELYNMENKP